MATLYLSRISSASISALGITGMPPAGPRPPPGFVIDGRRDHHHIGASNLLGPVADVDAMPPNRARLAVMSEAFRSEPETR
jgi:hypothetical protein